MESFRKIFWIGAIAWMMGLMSGNAREVQPVREWKGSSADASLRTQFAKPIRDAETWKKLWKTWGLEGEAPGVDFSKNLIVVVTTTGSRLNLSLQLDEAGDLKAGGLSTRDLRPGFRYHLAVVPLEGVKTVNGQPLGRP